MERICIMQIVKKRFLRNEFVYLERSKHAYIYILGYHRLRTFIEHTDYCIRGAHTFSVFYYAILSSESSEKGYLLHRVIEMIKLSSKINASQFYITNDKKNT